MRILMLEFKRVLKAKTTWIPLSLALVLSVLLAFLPVTYCYSRYTDEAGNEIDLTGPASIAYEKERQAGVAGVVTPQRVRQAVEAYQDCLRRYGVAQSYDLPEGVYEREILPFSPLLHGVKEAFANPDTGMAPTLMEIDPAWLDDYYAACDARLGALMKMEQPESPSAQSQAARMYDSVQKPFTHYPGFNTSTMDYQNILFFLVLIFCVVIAAPSFSAGYQSGADDILRCTRRGRLHLGVARVASRLVISGVSFLLCALLYVLVSNSLFGWECTKTSVQMAYSIVTLADMNIGQLQCFFTISGLISVLATVSLTLLFSSRCKNTVSSLACSMVLCLLPVVAFMILPGMVSTWLCAFLPASGVSIQASILYALTDFRFLNIGSLSVWAPYAMLGLCLLEIPLFSLLAIRSYCAHTA